ncbi:MAG: BamA/TamA family outer membrane protein, partial [Flavobacteriales bacterium]|nr:BamA/TamA family outer membrane protein [Flavobacteriales bacterium]
GGFQTKSLRLGNEEGKEFVFRSIQKDPKKILGEELQKTWIADIMQDQISMSHPYGAFVIAPLAEAVGIYHKNPKLVYIPDDPHLMEYRNLYKNTLALYEERASKHLEGYGNFGNASKAINTRKLLQKIYENNDNVIDAKNLLKNRLFDIWVGDWDRHEDQWRWVKFKCEEVNHDGCFHTIGEEGEDGSLYRPIPRDRDQVFVILDGVFPWLVRRKWTARLLPHFQNTIKDMKGLNINGGHIDRSFLNGLSKADWLSTAETMQAALSDAVIEAAIQQWPDTIFALDGLTIINKLKHRRDLLVESAERYYTILAKQVDVIGTDGAEYFEVIRQDDQNTQIRVYVLESGKVKGRKLYDRIIKSGETREIRIYGQGGNDHFDIQGEVRRGILIRIIGGEGTDSVTDNSHVRGMGKKTKVYDDLNVNQVSVGREARDLSSNEQDINSYNRKQFKYNYTAPRLLFGSNIDDGIFIGGGVYFKNYRFRKHPYGMTQKIVGSVALKTGAFNFYYEGRFIHLIKKWDLQMDLAVLAPNSTTNYFGMGNETVDFKIDDNYHLVRFNGVDFLPTLARSIGKFQTVTVGLGYRFVDIESSPNRFISDTSIGLSDLTFNPAHFGSIGFNYKIEKVDDKTIPKRGFYLSAGASHHIGLNEGTSQFSRMTAEAKLYIPFNFALKTVIALRFGGATILNDFAFYNANTLGAQHKGTKPGNLRGFKRDRFSGRTIAYQNIDVRIKLFSFRTYLFPGQFGILGFADQGRVWIDNEISTTWHRSYGGGFWLSPFDKGIITSTYQVSKDESLLNLTLGFLF